MAIDFDQLRQELSKDIVEGPEERYQFTWPDKRNAIRLANAPTTDTLRPCREESVDFDNTQNLYIEGDNLEVLKLLRENYLGKVKMIYIDPPYNTGNDFVYNDDFAQTAGDYVHNSGQEDEEGNRLVANTESNGRFHTDWLNMIYPRLKVARDLLSEDGVIFISIDNHEVENMLKICDEVYGVENRIACLVNVNNPKGRSDEKNIATAHEYLVVFQKHNATLMGFKPEENVLHRYNKIDSDGRVYRHIDLRKTGDSDRREDRPKMFYYFYFNKVTKEFYPSFDENCPNGLIKILPLKDDGTEGRWRVGLETAIDRINELEPVYMTVKKRWTIMEKDYLSDDLRVKATTAWTFKDLNSERGTEQFIELGFNKNVFSRPKPLGTVLRPLELSSRKDDIVLDFFSGSATTAHAVMQLNAEDGGNRRFIMVQLPEATDEKSEAYKAGYKNICEIGKERIRRAGKKIVEEQEKKRMEEGLFAGSSTGSEVRLLDIGFRVLKLDSSNMQDVYYSPEQFNENLLFEDNIKPNRTDEDLLFQAMIELGIELSAKIEKREIAGKTVWSVADNYLMACFDKDVNETTITEIARQHPYYFVLRDSSLATDNVADNFEQIWEEYSKETIRRIL